MRFVIWQLTRCKDTKLSPSIDNKILETGLSSLIWMLINSLYLAGRRLWLFSRRWMKGDLWPSGIAWRRRWAPDRWGSAPRSQWACAESPPHHRQHLSQWDLANLLQVHRQTNKVIRWAVNKSRLASRGPVFNNKQWKDGCYPWH